MLEAIDFSCPQLSKDEYRPRRDELMDELVVLQQQARERGVGLVVLFEGWDGAGKGSRISDLMYHLDARATSVHVTENLDKEAARAFAGAAWGVTGFYPAMQEFWKALGPRGTITFFDRGWYTSALQHLLRTEFGTLSLAGARRAVRTDSVVQKPDDALEREYIDVADLDDRTQDMLRIAMLRMHLSSSADFERQLVDDGYLVVKFFVHLTKKEQKKRLERLHDDPSTRWRVSEEKLAGIGNYREAYQIYDNLLEGSDFSFAPWHIVNGEDKRAANLAIAQTLVDALKGALAAPPDPAADEAAARARANSAGEPAREEASAADDGLVNPSSAIGDADVAATPAVVEVAVAEAAVADHAASPCDAAAALATTVAEHAVAVATDHSAGMREAAELEAAQQSAHAPHASRFTLSDRIPRVDDISHDEAFDPEEYKAALKKQQERLNKLELEMYLKRVPLMIMFEGWDAAGKGGAIKRVAQALDARSYTVFPSPAPTKLELLHPHLWRYWTRLPKAGHVGIYDRSWYGRVLVERVEGFAAPEEWSRAYDEINEFEQELTRWGALLLKFWVNVSPEEQLRRFQDREADPSKQWKITDEDWRNRDKYPQYKAAIDDMFRLTSTTYAPWTVLESDDKLHARIKALEIINDALEDRLHEN